MKKISFNEILKPLEIVLNQRLLSHQILGDYARQLHRFLIHWLFVFIRSISFFDKTYGTMHSWHLTRNSLKLLLILSEHCLLLINKFLKSLYRSLILVLAIEIELDLLFDFLIFNLQVSNSFKALLQALIIHLFESLLFLLLQHKFQLLISFRISWRRFPNPQYFQQSLVVPAICFNQI